jgi:hypothetical protein
MFLMKGAMTMKEPPRTVGEDMDLDPWKYDGYDGPRPYPKPGPMAHLRLRAMKAAEAPASENATTSAEPDPEPDYGTA